MQTILMTGGTGLVGRALTRALVEKGYKVIILTRQPEGIAPQDNISYALWDINKQQIDVQAVQRADHIIHLAGASVADKKWTASRKKEIVESRTNSSRLIIDTLKDHSNSVRSVISAGAIGWYGADITATKDGTGGLEGFIETAPCTNSFLSETCRLWEESLEPVTQLGKRLVTLRIGFVISNDGGVLAEFKKPLRFGLAAVLGSGKQVISWIHIEDLCRMFIYTIENEHINGCYNAVAPAPVNNKNLTLKLATAIRGKFYIPVHVPAFVLRLLLGQRSNEILKSSTVSCRKIKETGFVFLYPSITAALHELTVKK